MILAAHCGGASKIRERPTERQALATTLARGPQSRGGAALATPAPDVVRGCVLHNKRTLVAEEDRCSLHRSPPRLTAPYKAHGLVRVLQIKLLASRPGLNPHGRGAPLDRRDT